MELKNSVVLLTGSAGGIGSALAGQLVAKGARLALLDRDVDELERLDKRLRAEFPEAVVRPFAVDLLDREARDEAVKAVQDSMGDIDVLVNCAGVLTFKPFAEENPALLERVIELNLVVPMLLVRAVLPRMLVRGKGRVVNVGSTFGSIGFAWFAAYSASKFGLRGLSEALRREIDGSGVGVTYVAPRAVKTSLNTDSVYRMAKAVGMNMDEPEWVAHRIAQAIERDAKDVYLGFPESLFARLNGLLPRLVDSGLRKQSAVMAQFAREI